MRLTVLPSDTAAARRFSPKSCPVERALCRAFNAPSGLVRVFDGNALIKGALWVFPKALVADIRTWNGVGNPWSEPKTYEMRRG